MTILQEWGVTWAGARQFCVAGVSTTGGGSTDTEGFDPVSG